MNEFICYLFYLFIFCTFFFFSIGLLEHPSLPSVVSPEEVQYKIMLVGKNGVGKTATAANLTGYSPMENYYETPGENFIENYQR